MEKRKLIDLMNYVCDMNANVIIESLTKNGVTDDRQKRELMLAVEAKTKECFLRFIEKAKK